MRGDHASTTLVAQSEGVPLHEACWIQTANAGSPSRGTVKEIRGRCAVSMREMWWVGARRIHVLGFIAWTGPFRTEAAAKAAIPGVQAAERKRNGSGSTGCMSYVFVERDDDVEDAGDYMADDEGGAR